MKRLSAILIVAAMVVMLMPAMVWAAEITDGAFASDDVTLTEDSTLSTAIPAGKTLYVKSYKLTITNPANLLTGSEGKIVVEAGGSLVLGNNEWVGANGNLNLEAGSLEIDLGNKQSGILVTIKDNAQATVPVGREWTTTSATLNNAKFPTTIEAGSTLTVEGTFKVANDSTVTVNGSIDVADGGWMRVGAKGTVTGSGSITNNGIVTLHSANGGTETAALTGVQITLAGNGVAFSEFDASAFFTAADEETAGGYTVPGVEDDGGQLIQFSHKYSVPAGQVVPPVVNGPSYQIVWGEGSSTELWASPSTSNPTGSDEWASPSASSDSNKTNPSMGGGSDCAAA